VDEQRSGPSGTSDTGAVLFGDVDDLRQVLNHLDSGVVAHAADTTIRVCNPRACEILGLTMDQMVGVTAPDPKWQFVREDGSVMPLEEYPVVRVLQTRAGFDNLVVGVDRPVQGDRIWVQCQGYPVLDASGALQLAIITFIDVTEQRRAEEERRRLEGRLQQAMKMEAIGRLAGGVAHDFNNLLTGILGYAEMLEQTLPSGEAAWGYATEVRRGGEQAADLTRQLLAFARRQVVEPRVVQPNTIIGRSERMLKKIIGADVEVGFLPGEGLWNISVDPIQLDQVLLNLAVNARDAMPEGGQLTIETTNVVLEAEPEVFGEGSPAGRFVQLAVTDTGVGMDAETRERIFEPFFTTKELGEGTGLGLATTYGIMRQNGGAVRVYSEPGQGTTFKLYFPAVEAAVQPEPARLAPDPTVRSEVILLVEDNDLVRELACTILSQRGYEVLSTDSPAAALEVAADHSGTIDLLLSDIVMPGMNGRELHGRLLELRPGLEALFMSGYARGVVAQRFALGSETNFLQKPFSARGLLERIRDVLD